MTAFNRNFGGSSDGSGGNRPCQEHRAVQVAAGKALVLKDDRLLRCGIAIVGADIFAAEVDLISDALALADVAGLAGINCNGVGSFGHEILRSCCLVAADAAIVA